MEGNGGELYGDLRIEFLHVIADQQVPETPGFGGAANELGHGVVCVGGLHLNGVPVEFFVALPKSVFAVAPVHIRELPVGERAKHQIIHLVEGEGGQGDIRIPADVIDDALHKRSLCLSKRQPYDCLPYAL